MPSIESLGTPLAFRARTAGDRVAPSTGGIRLRSEVRALSGMQKEALVWNEAGSTLWRMVSDEGPYLQGTDLAPFPLAFYTAGVVFALMTEVQRHAAAQSVELASFAVTSDHYYTMEGSALRGDMIGGAKPVEMVVDIEANADADRIEHLVETALASSPAEAYMRDRLHSTFSLTANADAIEVADVRGSSHGAEDPVPRFGRVEPMSEGFLDEIITKTSTAEVIHGVEGGEGSSLAAEQKRTLHVRGEAKLLAGNLKEIRVRLLQPIGSSFCFLSEDGGDSRAPAALDYLSAGVGFCFMTQLGRYAHIKGLDLASYSIVQDSVFYPRETSPEEARVATAEPVDTHVFLTFDEPAEAAQRMVFMGERTCFLHAAMRGAYPTQIRLARSATT